MPFVPVVFSGLISMIIVLGIYVFRGLPGLSFANYALSFAAAFFYLLGFLFYFRAVKIEEVSRVVPLFYLLPFFVLFTSAVFLQEELSFVKYIGIGFLVLGAIMINQKGAFSLRFNRAFCFMILSAASISLNAVLTKYLLNFSDYWTVFAYTRGIFIFLCVAPVLYLRYSDVKNILGEGGMGVIVAISGSISLNLIGGILSTIATALGSVTLANALFSFQPLFVFIFALFISKYYPKIFQENLDRRAIILKFVSIILIAAGAILIT